MRLLFPLLFLLVSSFALTSSCFYYQCSLPTSWSTPGLLNWPALSRQIYSFFNAADPRVFLPPPLRGAFDQPPASLDPNLILAATNQHRAEAGLPPLKSNSVLTQAASTKANDILAQQYFDHISPDGTSPAELVSTAGYDFLITGENLALGNYQSEAALVQAWMDSPGHRANILKSGFIEIGLAAIPGTYEGHSTLVAVQTFATPASACDLPDETNQQQFDQQYSEAISLGRQLDQTKTDLDAKRQSVQELSDAIDQLAGAANDKTAAGNEEIRQGNQIAAETGSNEAAQPYWDRGEQLQAEAHRLQEQAQAKQSAYVQQQSSLQQTIDRYNQQVKSLQQLEQSLQLTTANLNAQIRDYNSCLENLSGN